MQNLWQSHTAGLVKACHALEKAAFTPHHMSMLFRKVDGMGKMAKSFAWMCVAVSLLFGATAQAKSGSFSYSGNTSFDFGALPGFSGTLQNGGSETILEVSANGGGGANFLGCSGLDIFGFLNIQFSVGKIVENFTQYMKTMVAKWLLTQLFSSPQLAAIFDTLQAFGNARLDMFKANCDIGEIKEDARNTFVDYCVNKKGGGSEARKECEENYDEESKNLLVQAANKFLSFKSTRSLLSSILRTTNFCGNSGSRACALNLFIPQMRLCFSGGVGNNSYSSCQDIGAAEAQIRDSIIKFPMLLSAMDHGFVTGVVQPVGDIMSEISSQKSPAEILLAIDEVERQLANPDTQTALLMENETPQFFKYDLDPVMYGNFALGNSLSSSSKSKNSSDIIEEFKGFLGCSYTDPFLATKLLVNVLGSSVSNVSTSNLNSGMKGVVENISKVLDTSGTNATAKALGLDVAQAVELLNVGMGCVINHHIHPSLRSMLKLQALPVQKRNSYNMVLSNNASMVLINKIIRFARQNMITARVGVAAEQNPTYKNGGCPENETPLSPEQLDAMGENAPAPCPDEKYKNEEGIEMVEAAIRYLENQVASIEEAQKQQTAFAKMSALVDKEYDAIMNGTGI